MIGIGIISYNNLAGVRRCVEKIRQHTRTSFELIVADDGSADGTSEWCLSQRIRLVYGPNRGVAFNENRLYREFSERSSCDVFIVLEQDTHPCEDSWELPWIAAAERYGHVAYCWDVAGQEPRGAGTADDPYFHVHFGAQCIATRRSAFEKVGYFDPRYYSLKYSGAHADWSFRFARLFDWPCNNGREICCLKSGVELLNIGSGWNDAEAARSNEITVAISCDPIYREAWFNEDGKIDFLRDYRSIHSNETIAACHASIPEPVHQNIFEFREWIRRLQLLQPKTMIEIGTYHFGTAQMTLRALPGLEKLITVDIEDRASQFPDVIDRYGGRLEFLQASSRDDSTFRELMRRLGKPTDAAFIDGDHSLIGVWNDFTRTLPLVRPGGLFGFHDVFPFCEGNYGSAEFFAGLKRRYPHRCEEIDCSDEGGPWEHYGIGVYRRGDHE